jgi:30S ribosomal protein S31
LCTISFFINLKRIIMGKGDMRTKRGKIFRGTFGRTRPRKVKKGKSKEKT